MEEITNKFKVGDKVRVVKKVGNEKIKWGDCMYLFMGIEQEVELVDSYSVRFTSSVINFPVESIELVEETKMQTPQESKYVVYIEGSDAPVVTHATLELAQNEAKRLVKRENKPTYVAQLLQRVKPSIEIITF